jgi:DNA polymerase elongation subunit (family B)
MRAGDSILVRGYENGRRIQQRIDYRPYIFIASPDGEYKTLSGLRAKKFYPGSMSEARQYIEAYKDVAGHHIFGTESYVYQYINDEYAGEIQYNPNDISVVVLDIETDSKGGFPNVATADKELTAITIRKGPRALSFGVKTYTSEFDYVTYIQCRDERDMIARFIAAWESAEWAPDVLTGWNVEFFDMPYIINRIRRLFDEATAKRLSPWRMWDKRRDPTKPDDKDAFLYTPAGVTILDYMQLYKKFAFGERESFKLDYIAQLELGERKLDYHELGFETLHEFYEGDFRNFMNYNIRDVDLVFRLDEKLKLLEQVYAIAYDGKVNLIDSLTTVGMWDVIIHNYLLARNTIVPLKTMTDRNRSIEGGHVKDPQVGQHSWVMSFDLNSLYPHLIMQYNISPETLVGQYMEFSAEEPTGLESVRDFLNGVLDEERDCRSMFFKKTGKTLRETLIINDCTMTPTGCVFSRKERGFLPTLMQKMYDDRVVWKKRMIEAKKAYEKNKTQELENEIARCHNMQLAKKIQLNSAYGALSNQFFRWFDMRLAESITRSGQLSIRWMEKHINQYMNRVLKTQSKDYVIAIDTDSMYLTVDALVQQVKPTAAKPEIVEYLDKAAQKIFEPFIDKTYSELAAYVNAFEQKMKMKREAIADKGIWTAKKHYVLNVWDLEGVRYEAPKLKMQGIEAVRSSTPAACREDIKSALKIIMGGTERELQDFIDTSRKAFRKLSFTDVAFPRSVRGVAEKDVVDGKGKLLQKSYYTGTAAFMKSTPIHVKGALMYNFIIKKRNLTHKYPLIGEGEKIKFCYVLDSSPIPTNVISTPGDLPPELNLDAYVDYETQFDKAFVEPLRTILDVIGWKVSAGQQTLEDFFA